MKRLDQLTQLTAAQLATDDILGIRDQSAGVTKYITVKDLTGAPEFGWVATGESWVYSSFNSTLNTGVVTVPTDATLKYTVGMWARFSQTTGGTKWAKIVAVTATTLTLDFANGVTLANEAITSPVYSPLARPFGVPPNTSYIHTYTSTGSGGGTGYFENINGVKRCWGVTGVFTGGSGLGVSLSFPTGFFTTVQSAQLNSYSAANTSIHGALAYNSMLTTGLGAFAGGSPAGNQQMTWYAVGT